MPRSLVLALSLLAPIALAQINQTPNLTGHWTASGESFGTRTSFAFDLEQKGDKLTGKFAGDPVDGSTDGRVFQFLRRTLRAAGSRSKAPLSTASFTATSSRPMAVCRTNLIITVSSRSCARRGQLLRPNATSSLRLSSTVSFRHTTNPS